MLALPQLLISIGIVAACSTTKEGCLGGIIQPGIRLVIGGDRALHVAVHRPRSCAASRSRCASRSSSRRAARSARATTRIIFREILPNLIGPIIVYTTLLIPQSILFEAALSYLGLGVPPDTASWGGLLNEASALLRRRLVADALPGPVPRHHDAGLQPARRRPPRRARRAGRPLRSSRRPTNRWPCSVVKASGQLQPPVVRVTWGKEGDNNVKRPIRRLVVAGSVVAVGAAIVVGCEPPAKRDATSKVGAGGTLTVGWEQSFGFTDNFDPTGEYLGDAWGIYIEPARPHARGLQPRRRARRATSSCRTSRRRCRSRRTAARPTRSTSSRASSSPAGEPRRHVEGRLYALERLANPKDGGQYAFYYTVDQGLGATARRARRSPASRRRTTSTIVFNLTQPTGDFLYRAGDAGDGADPGRGRRSASRASPASTAATSSRPART